MPLAPINNQGELSDKPQADAKLEENKAQQAKISDN